MPKENQLAKKKRNRLIVRTVILILLAAAIIYAVFSKDEFTALGVGDMAPDFELVDLEGNKHRLSDYRGEGVFLNFWGTWCPPCKREMPHMEKVHKELDGDGVNILTINIKDTLTAVENFRTSFEDELTFPIMRDTTESVKEIYNFKPLPTTFIIDANGKIKEIISREMSEDEIRTIMLGIRPE